MTKLAEQKTTELLAEEMIVEANIEQHRLWLAYEQKCIAAWTEKQAHLAMIAEAKKMERMKIQKVIRLLKSLVLNNYFIFEINIPRNSKTVSNAKRKRA